MSPRGFEPRSIGPWLEHFFALEADRTIRVMLRAHTMQYTIPIYL